MANANRTSLAYAVESSWGVNPGTALKDLAYTGESFGFNISNTASNNIRADRQVAGLNQNGADASGGFNFELQYGASLQDFLLGALWANAWTAGGVDDETFIINGTTQHSYYFERSHEDVAQYFQFAGMVVNTFNLTISANQIITGSVDFKGKGATRTDATAGTGTNTAADTGESMSAVTNVGSIKIDNIAVSSCFIKEISLSISNNVEGDDAVGVLGYCDIDAGEIAVTGNLKCKFVDGTMYDKYLAAESFSLAWNCTDADGNLYTFELPNCKISTDKINASGKNTKVTEDISYQAIMDPVLGYTIKITRNPV